MSSTAYNPHQGIVLRLRAVVSFFWRLPTYEWERWLFACNVGEYIDLPQLVVVGDQSSGKSSVLEALARLLFPRDSGLAANHLIKISILPAPKSTAEYRELVKEWNKSDIKQLDVPAFATIMSDVTHASGLRKTLSNGVLRLEIHGPDEAHLSVIDVPDIFRTTTTGVTTTADKELVRHMVEIYMRNLRIVMLTVVPANGDPATQEILEMAKEVDPDRHRTIGVLTKPDLVSKGARQKIVDIIKGKSLDAKLDWSVVRNLGHAGGIDLLQKRLEEVLTQHIRREFLKVKVEINKKLGRDTAEKQAKYLLNLAMQFQHIAGLAVKANYRGNGIFNTFTDIRLATELVSRNEKFSMDLEKFDHQYQFQKVDHVAEESYNAGVDHSDNEITYEEQRHHTNTRHIANALELDEILSVEDQVAGPSRLDIFDWLKAMYSKSRGFELGTFASSLLTAAMRQHSSKWQAMSSGYTSDTSH
ncbi:hypothetical protein K469DRAFT_725111 [Zopfia rhizophila CBS 207.26]|uniref:Dynamin-type G domain-containing protein n=1 Tax=Zopfia rhizophila CBS 207.26 TaxID=1314779 RepID=A0A6A6E8Y2_9PEZI|nr:hypothetical protein K469DRAFT_725111 [Zopfia rhizophila CBS 207.26]